MNVKLRNMMALGMSVAFAAAALPVFAEDAKPAAPAAAPAAPAAPAAAPAAPAEPAKSAEAAKKKPAAGAGQPKTEVKATVAGKLETKQVKNKKSGKMQDVLVLTVTSATGPDGKSMEGQKGKPLRVMGKKELNLKSFAGKDVTIEGTIVNQRRLAVNTIK